LDRPALFLQPGQRSFHEGNGRRHKGQNCAQHDAARNVVVPMGAVITVLAGSPTSERLLASMPPTAALPTLTLPPAMYSMTFFASGPSIFCTDLRLHHGVKINKGPVLATIVIILVALGAYLFWT
jgi:hypothetical protein